MADTIQGQAVADAVLRASNALLTNSDYLTELDQMMGDGDTGITLGKVAAALIDFVNSNPADDIGNFLAKAGMAANKAAPSTLGTLTATALMKAGKEVKGQTELSVQDLATMFSAADDGVQQRGKAKLGDKTIVDALHPASVAFAEAVAAGASLMDAGMAALRAAEAGRDQVTPLRSQIGRASWVGERTEGKVDPGCAALVVILSALINPSALS
ncbi:MAG: PEP-dependent dihydroxyacetone kinase 2, ADP-binding subunit DhaL [Anaerolineae bacterium]|mgnify:CR=1 FL=1|nr:PEP-dependent dihydroxyacetone kinase 2, ADP-binding subunit DhaL [Anaerolineae bacterium]